MDDSGALFDLYGEMIRNNQKLKDLSPSTLKKAKSEEKNKSPLPKVVVKKDKLIFKFLKSKAEKEEIQKIKEEVLKQSMQTVESQSISQETSTLMLGSMD